MTKDETHDTVTMVAEYARDLGLHGVMILSPRCPKCGNCHDFSLTASATEQGNDEASVRALLLHFADVATSSVPTRMALIPRTRQ